jgi:uncharacterized glyoxalase superfamily protein PhnB
MGGQTTPDENPSVLEAAVLILSVTDLLEALDYYQRVLGFKVEWTSETPMHLASVCRDRVELNLCQASDAGPSISKVYFQMAGVDAFYDSIARAGASVAVVLADRAYGMRDFRIIDPSGNELSFGEATHS